jgi:hypothetical protein
VSCDLSDVLLKGKWALMEEEVNCNAQYIYCFLCVLVKESVILQNTGRVVL